MSAGRDAARTLLVALGGNALVRKGQTGTIAEQFENLRLPLSQVARLSRDWRIILTHGNGPQVGELLLRQECCPHSVRLPLEILVAQTQGQIGYMMESTLDAELMQLEAGGQKPLVSLISYVVVDADDPAFAAPTKPIGPVLSEEQAASAGYPVRRTAKGLRRVVASPRPLTIVEKREIATLVADGFIVICCGGGGIPVVREGRRFCGVDAVIDKDLASARLAQEVGVDVFVIVTDVAGAYLDYGTPAERLVERLRIDEAMEHLRGGQFPPGSMGPKIEACAEFLRGGGSRAVICGMDAIEDAVAGRGGTEIVR
ncbi:carbamate kinase [Desulfobaculum xiamenense]|uniref:Carbamate kinase n=1 Tax=Desulfobaculum xiamenense TaxID=995050 RepID=A0A846QL32_9BACT|nr:carbamate kinase [Desulfobaculum xiamenense]NJB67162.1 carbamate kinase [Desulfobaculum xiamenense]